MALMLDPSLLLRAWTLEDVREARPASASATFLELARSRALSSAALTFFGPRGADRSEVADLARSVAEAGDLEPHRAGPEEALPLPIRDPVVRSILLDEWSFVQGGDWIASRVRRPFSAFVRAGAASVELHRASLEGWSELPDILDPSSRLRVAATWLALGGVEILEELQPALPAPAAGAFLLFED